MKLPEMHIRNATEIDTTEFTPPTAASITLRATIDPPTGGLLVYSPASDVPVRLDGSGAVGIIQLQGTKIYIQPVSGTVDWKLTLEGWTDSV